MIKLTIDTKKGKAKAKMKNVGQCHKNCEFLNDFVYGSDSSPRCIRVHSVFLEKVFWGYPEATKYCQDKAKRLMYSRKLKARKREKEKSMNANEGQQEILFKELI